MYKRILVAVDGSDTSNQALQEAVKLAKEQKSMLRLLHVVDLTMAYSAVEAPYIFEYRKAMEAAGKTVLAECSAAARTAGIEVDSKCVVMFGKHIYDVVEEEATEWAADLIVIGTHGRRGIRRLLLGSVAEGLTRARMWSGRWRARSSTPPALTMCMPATPASNVTPRVGRRKIRSKASITTGRSAFTSA